MVCDYSSYLEFVGAIYFTMCLDEILTKKLWSPLNLREQERALDGLGLEKDNSFKQAVNEANKQKGQKLQCELSKKSTIGLFVIAGLLVFCGYESNLNNILSNNLGTLQTAMSYTSVIFLLSMFLMQWFLFDKWKYVVLYIFALFVFFCAIYTNELFFDCLDLNEWCRLHVGIIVCTSVTIPILWQIFITWIHRNIFYGYIKTKIIQAQAKHKRAMDLYDAGEYDKLPTAYKNIYLKVSNKTPETTAKEAKDDSLTEYMGVLYNEIRTIGLKIRLYELVISWIWHTLKKLFFGCIDFFTTGGKSAIGKEKIQVKDFAYHAARYKELKIKKKSFKMQEYCKSVGISFDEFNKYYSKYCNENK